MASDKRELILDLLSRNKMGPGTEGAARDLDKVGTAADRAGKKTEGLGRESTVAGHEVDKLGRNAADTRDKVARLDREIDSTKRDLVELAAAFATAGSAAERMDISKALNRTQADLRRLTKNKGILEDLLPDPTPAARSFSQKLNQSILGELASSSLPATAGAVLGAALAPTVGGLVAGAVLGGVGGLGVLGGLALAAKDPAVSGWGKAIGQEFSKNVNASAKDAFVQPAMRSLAQVEALASRTGVRVGKIFQNTAPSVDGLTRSVVRASDAIGEGLVTASAASAKPMAALGGIVESTGQSLREFLEMLASHSDEGASSLDDLNTALQNALHGTTLFVDGLANMKGGLDNVDGVIDKSRYWLEDHARFLDLTADGYKKGSEAALLYRKGIIGAAGSANDYSHYLAGATTGTANLADQMTNAQKAALGQRDAMSALSKELRAQADPAFALLNAQDNLATSQKNLNKAIKEHGAKSAEARKATRDLAVAALDLQGKVGDLGSTFSGKLTPAMRATLQAAGLTPRQIRAVEREFLAAKRAGEAYSQTYVAKVRLDGVAGVKNAARTIRATLASIRDKTVHVNYQINGKNSSEYRAAYDKNARASGGPVNRGIPYLVGEQGPEIVVPRADATVLSAAATRGVMRQSGGYQAPAGGTGGGTVRLELAGEQQVVTFLRSLIRKYDLV